MSQVAEDRSGVGATQGMPLWKKLALSGATLLAGLLLVEGGMHLFAGEPWYLQIVEHQTPKKTTLYRVGGYDLPLRAPPPPAHSKQPGTYRIFFLGDSFTYGEGLESESHAFVSKIVDRLNAELPVEGIARYESFNGGIPGSMTHHWVTIFDRTAERFEPDLVVAVFFLRDGVADVSSIGQIKKIRDEMRTAYEQSTLMRWSRVYRFVQDRVAFQRLSDGYLGKLREAYLGRGQALLEWQRAQANLRYIRDGATNRGAGFAMVVFPVLFALHVDYPLTTVCEEIESFARGAEMPVLSLLPAYLGQDASTLWVSPLDQHPNEKGHAIAADALYPFIIEQIRNGSRWRNE